ncbi:DUF1156 domain-containing protein [Mailhella massiliensis]|uniref:DUF1156 domain-containing protein n=2 Tax=Mailhella massiliensis TaxID=1903261 RepID=UPI002352628F|nr:DUF1156 domain-containing protein [Mailhella massiliensis]
MSQIKKLIEVALPLEAINDASAYEKMPGIGPHPRGIHHWWARRPLAAARAVIWSSLVDDPSSHPELFPTEQEQEKERQRLHSLLARLSNWKNVNDEELMDEARAEIKKYMGEEPLVFLDPFAGGGAIPLEAQRLGLEAHAHDLNPVAVMINKAMIEIPPRFAGQAPVNPEARAKLGQDRSWRGATGLAEDVRYYGEWIKQEAVKRIGHLYPTVQVPIELGGGKATVIAWIWARTIKCSNPACGCEVPLVNNFVLSKKKGKAAWIEPHFENGTASYEVHHSGKPNIEGTVNRKGAVCACCGTPVPFTYIREQGRAGAMSAHLMAVVVDGKNGRLYLSADSIHANAAQTGRPEDYPDALLPQNPRNFNTPNYGLSNFSDLFTDRQLTALTTFSTLVTEAQKKAMSDALVAGMDSDETSLAEGGSGALAYGQAVGTYLANAVDRLADFSTSVSRWSASNEKPMNLFSKQAIPMTWDFPETNILGEAVGGFSPIVQYVADCILKLPKTSTRGFATQHDAQSDCGLRSIVISTDPPYYDNIGYADLSDFFYVWLRRSLKATYPQLFRTMLVPKTEELVATPYRFEGSKEKAREFFEDGMFKTCCQLYKYSREDVPVTIYYAYKQSDSDESQNDSQTASTGWETMLSAIIQAGFSITGTWPLRTEQAYRSVSMNTNALASSIVLVCRKRPEDAPSCTRRSFIAELKRELRTALKKLQSSNIAPVDMAQAAIGPGMGVYSRYSRVLEADGSPMNVRSALQTINAELDLYFSEQDGVLDAESRFCVDLYTQFAFNNMKFGEADVLARAKNTSVERLAEMGLVYSEKGVVHLFDRSELPEFKAEARSSTGRCLWMLTQYLCQFLEKGGVEACAMLCMDYPSDAERARDLAYRLFSLAERKGWNAEAYAYNSLVVSWPEIQQKVSELRAVRRSAQQGSLI